MRKASQVNEAKHADGAKTPRGGALTARDRAASTVNPLDNLSREQLGEMLVAAATEGDAELCGKLLLRGADVNYQTDVCYPRSNDPRCLIHFMSQYSNLYAPRVVLCPSVTERVHRPDQGMPHATRGCGHAVAVLQR